MRESNHLRGRKGDPWEKRNCMRRKYFSRTEHNLRVMLEKI
uniref:Uncharacterized protein n=1 Tax=Vitis vinifera TaxID=29760 RepID=F6HQC3_VITVI